MRSFSWKYPGDPVDVCVVMNRAEFLQQFPRTPIKIHSEGRTEEIPMAPDEILCDLCGNDPGDEIYVIHRGRKGYCKECAGISVIPNMIEP